jgi:glycosyltransferase involved in cell wall biosynthesis
MYSIRLVSIVIPCYNEAGNIVRLAKEIFGVMKNTPYNYEVFFINDGSTDNSWESISQLTDVYPFIHGIDLSGNYGQTIALRAGLEASQGDVIVAMDGDMQHDPVYIPQFLKYIEKGYDMVSGAKESRPEGMLKTFMANVAHSVICRISGINLHYFGATFKVYRRYLFNNVSLIGDSHRFLGALVARKGTKYIELPIKIRERISGVSNYKMSKILFVIVDLVFLKFIVSYMNKPFRLFGVIGLVMLVAGFCWAAYYGFGAIFLH